MGISFLQTRLAHQKAVNLQACTMNTRTRYPGLKLQLGSQAHRASAGGSPASVSAHPGLNSLNISAQAEAEETAKGVDR